MPMQIRLNYLERTAAALQEYPAWRVTVYSLSTGQPELTYFACGKCSLKEKDCPSGKPERRDMNVAPGATCAYCNKEARSWIPV